MFWIVTLIILLVFVIMETFLIIFVTKKLGVSKKDIRNQGVINRMMQVWLRKKIEDADFIEKYLVKKGYRTIAVYGNNLYTNYLVDELKDSDIVIKYIVAGTWSTSTKGIPLTTSFTEEVDATVITTDVKCQDFKENYKGDLLTIYDILYGKDL